MFGKASGLIPTLYPSKVNTFILRHLQYLYHLCITRTRQGFAVWSGENYQCGGVC